MATVRPLDGGAQRSPLTTEWEGLARAERERLELRFGGRGSGYQGACDPAWASSGVGGSRYQPGQSAPPRWRWRYESGGGRWFGEEGWGSSAGASPPPASCATGESTPRTQRSLKPAKNESTA